MKYSHVAAVGWIINGFVAFASVLLSVRMVLALFAADGGTTFVHWVYQNSAHLLFPFRGVFQVTSPQTGHLLDFAALFAMLVYVFVGYLLLVVLGSVKKK